MVDPIDYPLLIRSASYYWPGTITGHEIGHLFSIRLIIYIWTKTLPSGEKVYLPTIVIEKDYE